MTFRQCRQKEIHIDGTRQTLSEKLEAVYSKDLKLKILKWGKKRNTVQIMVLGIKLTFELLYKNIFTDLKGPKVKQVLIYHKLFKILL